MTTGATTSYPRAGSGASRPGAGGKCKSPPYPTHLGRHPGFNRLSERFLHKLGLRGTDVFLRLKTSQS